VSGGRRIHFAWLKSDGDRVASLQDDDLDGHSSSHPCGVVSAYQLVIALIRFKGPRDLSTDRFTIKQSMVS
jgi:hypothetical protein